MRGDTAQSDAAGGWRPDQGEIDAIVSGDHGNPFGVLGPHAVGSAGYAIRVFAPDTEAVEVIDADNGSLLATLERVHQQGFYAGVVAHGAGAPAYKLRLRRGAHRWEVHDPYRFPPYLGELDTHLLAEGSHQRLYERLGAHPVVVDGVAGVVFAVWAPNARRVSVVGDFNAWDGRRHPMRRRVEAGVWELFLPGVGEGALYKYEIVGPRGDRMPLKSRPLCIRARGAAVHRIARRRQAALDWQDDDWLSRRKALQERSRPDLDLRGARRLLAPGRRATASSVMIGWPTSSSRM